MVLPVFPNLSIRTYVNGFRGSVPTFAKIFPLKLSRDRVMMYMSVTDISSITPITHHITRRIVRHS